MDNQKADHLIYEYFDLSAWSLKKVDFKKEILEQELISLIQFWNSDIFSKRPSPQLILFFGEVGAGKTTFISHWTNSLGILNIQSPTFSFHNKYESENSLNQLDHFDLYRAETVDDLESIGFWDLLIQSKKSAAVEWPDKIDSNYWLGLSHFKSRIVINISNENESNRRNYTIFDLDEKIKN